MDARPISQLTFEQALEFANSGCDLVQRKAIEAAKSCGLPLVIRSLNENEPMSRIVDIEIADECDKGDFVGGGSILAIYRRANIFGTTIL